MNELFLKVPQTVVQAVVWSAVCVFLTWYWQQRRIRRLQRRLQRLGQDRGHCEVALVLSAPRDVLGDVRAYLDNNGHKEIPVLHVHDPAGFDDREESWDAYLEQVKQQLREIPSVGRIHLFVQVPAAMSVLVGAVLKGGPEVVVHHWFNGTYRPVLRLAYETTKL